MILNKIIKKYLIFLFLSFISINIFADLDTKIDNTSDVDNSWIHNFITLDPSDDLYADIKLKNYTPDKDYVKNLIWHQDIDFFIDKIDQYNLRKNINILPHYPYVHLLYGGYSYNRGFDLGFLFRADNLANTRLALTASTSFAQNDRFWLNFNVEYPAFLNDRLKLYGTISFFTSAPQYSSRISLYPSLYIHSDADESTYKFGDFLMTSFFNKIWNKLGINFNKYRDIGFYQVGGIDYRIPFIELNLIVGYEFMYNYVNVKDGTELHEPITEHKGLPEQISVDENNFGFNLITELRWNKMKQTATIPEGYSISLATKFYLPTTIGLPNNDFRFKSRTEFKFNKKLFREFAFKTRFLLAANYNISEDFSGDPYIRGLADYELTGWFGFLGNIEALIPIVDVDMIRGPGTKTLKKPAKFVVYLTLFLDGGFTIENYDYHLEHFYERLPREKIQNSLIPGDPAGQTYLGNNHYILPTITAGGGLHFYPYFLNFIMRIDVGVNILKAAIYQTPECIEFVFSFNQTF